MGSSFDSFVTSVPICLPDATVNTTTTSATTIFCTLWWHCDKIHLLICILAPTVTKLRSALLQAQGLGLESPDPLPLWVGSGNKTQYHTICIHFLRLILMTISVTLSTASQTVASYGWFCQTLECDHCNYSNLTSSLTGSVLSLCLCQDVERLSTWKRRFPFLLPTKNIVPVETRVWLGQCRHYWYSDRTRLIWYVHYYAYRHTWVVMEFVDAIFLVSCQKR